MHVIIDIAIMLIFIDGYIFWRSELKSFKVIAIRTGLSKDNKSKVRMTWGTYRIIDIVWLKYQHCNFYITW